MTLFLPICNTTLSPDITLLKPPILIILYTAMDMEANSRGIEIRYAEILLDYAEAENEAKDAPDASVYDALNQIRQRAGITTPLSPGLSQSAMRDLIHNERYIELCFEGQRYWDLKRWKTAVDELNGKKFTGVVITKHPGNTFIYEYAPVDPAPDVFDPKMYLMPIPQSEITKDPNLIQNSGW